MYTYIYIYTCLYIYIYTERERERARQRARGRERSLSLSLYIYIYIYIYVYIYREREREREREEEREGVSTQIKRRIIKRNIREKKKNIRRKIKKILLNSTPSSSSRMDERHGTSPTLTSGFILPAPAPKNRPNTLNDVFPYVGPSLGSTRIKL